jgi:serralysin
LIGDSVANMLTGLFGKDVMAGGASNDSFDFNISSETVKGASRDVITDFSGFGVEFDAIDLSDIDAKPVDGDQAFKFIGDSKFHHKVGELRVVDKGAFFLVAGDIDGNGNADFQIEVHSAMALVKDDFIL